MSSSTKNVSKSQLVQFYANKNILITGAAGFLGMLIVQKLLRSCPEIKGLYLILREKKGKDADERLNELLNDPVFDALKNEVPDFQKKIYAINGNLQYEGMSLNTNDRQMLINKINIVLHLAATVNFDEALRTAVNINIRGTKELLDLCEEMKHLVCVMVTSTAYSFCPRQCIGEHFMEPPISPDTIMKMVENIDEKMLNDITPKLMGNWPNTYTFTKAIMEDLIRSRRDKLPIGLCRPSIVLPTYKDPLLCWTSNINGPIGLSIAVGMGIIHTLLLDENVKADYVPADYYVNAFLTASHDIYKKYNNGKIPDDIIYNYVATTKHSITFKQYTKYCYMYLAPFTRAVWTMFLFYSKYKVIFFIYTAILHYLPAVLADVYRIITMKKTRFVKMCNKIYRRNITISYFLLNEWDIQNKNVVKLWKNMMPIDQSEFPFDITTLDWDDFYKNYSWGGKKYILKEKMDKESLQKDHNNYNKLRLRHSIFTKFLAAICIIILWKVCSSIIGYLKN